MTKTKTLLVGTGFWAEQHLKAYQLCKKTIVSGIVGHSNKKRLEELATNYNISSFFFDTKEAIRKLEPDIVDIATSPVYRLEGVKAAVNSSVKLVNMEKPMALFPSEAKNIEKICLKNNLLLTVNHQKKFNKPWAEAAKIIKKGTLGRILFFRATCRGNMLEQGTHLVDMLLFFNNYTPIKWVMAQTADFDGFKKPKTPAPDSVSALIQFDNETPAYLTIGNIGWPIDKETNKWFHMAVEAYGSKGHLRISLNQTMELNIYGKKTLVTSSKWDDTYLQGLADHFDAASAYAMNPEKKHISCLKNSIMSFEAIMAMYKSSALGDRIMLPTELDDLIIDIIKKRAGM